jgi:nucleoside 2-deoxyribosyltransferase
MKRIKIYLAGKMMGLQLEDMSSWREELKNKILREADDRWWDALVINPVDYYNFEEHRHQSEEEVEEYDLGHVITSDLIVVNLDGLNTSDGSKLEIHDAHYNHNIPVIAFGDRSLYDNLHPWTKMDITRVENDIDGVVEYIKDFYLI